MVAIVARIGRVFGPGGELRDRFGAVLVLTTMALATMALVDLHADATVGHVGSSSVSLLIGVTLLLALRASVVTRRWLIGAGIVFAVGALGTVVELTLDQRS